MEPFVREVRRRAAALGITQAEVGRRSGVSIRAFSHYLSERSEPNLGTLVRIAEVLGCTPNDLLGIGQTEGSGGEGDEIRRRIAVRCRQFDVRSLRLALLLVEAVKVWQIQVAAETGPNSATRSGEACGPGHDGDEDR